VRFGRVMETSTSPALISFGPDSAHHGPHRSCGLVMRFVKRSIDANVDVLNCRRGGNTLALSAVDVHPRVLSRDPAIRSRSRLPLLAQLLQNPSKFRSSAPSSSYIGLLRERARLQQLVGGAFTLILSQAIRGCRRARRSSRG